MIGLRGKGQLRAAILAVALLLMLPGAPLSPAQSSSSHGVPAGTGTGRTPIPPHDIENDVPGPLNEEQRQSIMRANFEKSKSDAEELAELAKGLREALEMPAHKVPSSEIVLRAEKIEKLAKKIRDETKGF